MARQPKGTVKDSFEPPRAKSHRKTGLPASLEQDREIAEQQSPEEFAKEFFGGQEIVHSQIDQSGLPSLEWLGKTFQTKSARVRYLHSELGGNHPPKVIAKHLGIRYQMARNICTTPLKRGPNEDWQPKVLPNAPLSTKITPHTEEDEDGQN